MSLLDILPIPFVHTSHEQLPPVAHEIDLPPFEKPDIEFMPLDTRSAQVAALAVTKYGEQVINEHPMASDAELSLLPNIAAALIERGAEAAGAYDVHQVATYYQSPDKYTSGANRFDLRAAVPADEADRAAERFDQVAKQRALRGAEAAVVLYALSELAQTDDKTISPIDAVTAQHMLEEVDHESRVIRA